MSRLQPRFLDCKGMSLAEAESFGTGLAEQQRDVMFQLGDLARYCEARFPDTWQQAFPEWVSPGLIARAAGVAKAYPKPEDRQSTATWTQYMQNASRPDRLERLQAIVEAGLTTDESRKAKPNERPRWLLAVDVNYYLHRFWFSGAGVEAAVGVAQWIQRTATRLQDKGLTDVLCCFDAPSNHRKELTAEWDAKYKDRPPKDQELVAQLRLVRELLDGRGFACASIDGMEADDLLASAAAQFDGRVTILSCDKDIRQCLSSTCNILLDVEWAEDETSGDMLPSYKWLSAKQHTDATGIRPEQWTNYQAIMGDTVDGIKGAPGIGEKGAADLIATFGSAAAAIEAAEKDDERITPKRRESLLVLKDKLDVTLQLVTLRTDLPIPTTTRIT